MQHSIKVSAIKVSAKTARVTGYSSVEEIIKNQANLFVDYSEPQIMELLKDLYNGKLKPSDKAIIDEMATLEEKREHAVSTLTFQLELVQEATRTTSGNQTSNANPVAFFLRNRINVTNQTSRKLFWQTVDLGTLVELDYKKDADFSAIMKNNGYFTYLLRTNSFDPELNADGRIVSAPKRAGAGGDILTKDGKLIFTTTNLVMQKFDAVEEYDENYDACTKAELDNQIAFKHDAVIDVVENTQIPTELRQKDGTFNDEFQEWLHEAVNVGLGNQVSFKAIAVAA